MLLDAVRTDTYTSYTCAYFMLFSLIYFVLLLKIPGGDLWVDRL